MSNDTASPANTVRGTITPLTLAGYECNLYLPKQYTEQTNAHFPVAYLLGESNIAPVMQTVEKQFCPPFIVLGIEAVAWETDFSPWPAAPLVQKSKPFTGGAPAFLLLLQNEIKPYLDSHYRTLPSPEHTTIAGYSLAGLTTLFALYTTNFARNFASMSGSLWYEGWVPFCEEQTAPFVNKTADTSSTAKYHLYLSLGNTEKNSRHQLMCKVDDCTQATLKLLEKQLHGTCGDTLPSNTLSNSSLHFTNTFFFEYNTGGHFNDISSRIAKGLVFLHKNYLYPADYLGATT
jgi:predicted alpha/beta superfamily hydrolase